VYGDSYQLGRMSRDDKGNERWTRLANEQLPGWAERAERIEKAERQEGMPW
jgi:hypothetical protein